MACNEREGWKAMGDQGQPKRKAGFNEVGKSPKSTSAALARTCARGEGQHATHAHPAQIGRCSPSKVLRRVVARPARPRRNGVDVQLQLLAQRRCQK